MSSRLAHSPPQWGSRGRELTVATERVRTGLKWRIWAK